MNYLSIYNSIVSNARSAGRKKRKHIDPKYVYYERHHIKPKCLGGENDKENLILLTAKEHFVVHQLLIKIYPNTYKLVFALRMMCRNNNKNHIRNNKEYEWIKKLSAITLSESQKGKSYGYKFTNGHTKSVGEKNGMYGKNHTNETRKIQSEKAKNRDPSSYDIARLPKTDLHKENISKSKRKSKYKLTSPNGIEIIFNRVQDASIHSGISTSVLVKLAGNRYGFDHCRGWKISAISI